MEDLRKENLLMGDVNSRAVKVILMEATVLKGYIRKFYSNFKY